MPTDLKWLIGFVFAVILLFAVGLGVNAYIDHSCRTTMAKEGKSTDDIVRICR